MTELKLIIQSLYKFEKWLYGFNYECHFRIERVNKALTIQEACERISESYPFPLAVPAQSLQLISYDEFINELSAKFHYRGDIGAGVSLTPKQEVEFEREFEILQKLISQTFDSSQTDIYIHPEIRTWVYWGFCFLVASNKYNAIYLFEGIASD